MVPKVPDNFSVMMQFLDKQTEKALEFLNSGGVARTSKQICRRIADLKPQERVDKFLQDRRTEVPLEPRHDCVASEKDPHAVKRIMCNPYTSSVLTHSIPKDGEQAPWHDLAAQSKPDDKSPTTWVGRVIADTLGGAQIYEPLIDGTYLCNATQRFTN